MEWEVVSLPGGAAGSGVTYRLPGGERTRIGSLAFRVDCAGGGPDRQVVAQLFDGTDTPLFSAVAPGLQASGTGVAYSFAPLVPLFGSAALGFMGGPFPGGWLPPNIYVFIGIANIGVGDVITNGRLVVGQYPVIESAEA